MTRTDALKGVYVARLVGVVLSGIGAAVAIRNGATATALGLGALFAALALSGRIQAHFWSELLLGLHALGQRDYETSKAHSTRFLAQLRERPWLRRLIWLGTSSYSLNAEVLALNNLGAAELSLGEFDAARGHLEQAMALDPQCPLPFRNMGALILRTGATAEAEPWFAKAAGLGLRGDLSDRLTMAAQRRNAERSAPGAAGGVRPPPPPEPPVSGAYLVYLLNDEETPAELVVTALETVFGMTGARAIATARRAHESGRAACAGFDDAASARQKADELAAFARANGYEMICEVEPGEA